RSRAAARSRGRSDEMWAKTSSASAAARIPSACSGRSAVRATCSPVRSGVATQAAGSTGSGDARVLVVRVVERGQFTQEVGSPEVDVVLDDLLAHRPHPARVLAWVRVDRVQETALHAV